MAGAGAIKVLAGTAGAGKTSRMLDAYRHELRKGLAQCDPGRTLWLAPTQRACVQTRAALLDASLPVCIRPNVLTFEGFAERVVKFSTETIRPLTPVMQRTLIRRIVASQLAAGELEYFSGIAETS